MMKWDISQANFQLPIYGCSSVRLDIPFNYSYSNGAWKIFSMVLTSWVALKPKLIAH